MSDLYAVERLRRSGTRFELVVVDVYQRGSGRVVDDIRHLQGHEVVVPRGAQSGEVDALIAASLLQLQAQAAGEVAERVALAESLPPRERRDRAVGMTSLTASRLAAAGADLDAALRDADITDASGGRG